MLTFSENITNNVEYNNIIDNININYSRYNSSHKTNFKILFHISISLLLVKVS